MESGFLVPPGRTTSVWAAYELWNAQNELRTPDRVLASYETGFGVFNPSRYGNPGPTIARTLDLCRETEPSGDRANGPSLRRRARRRAPSAFDDPRSPFDGTHRDTYLRDTTLTNAGGPHSLVDRPIRRQRLRHNRSQAPSASSSPPLTRQPAHASNNGSSAATARHDAPGVHAPN